MPTVDQLLAQPKSMPTVDRLLAHERRPGSAPVPALPPAAGNNLGLLSAFARTLNGLPNRTPLPPAPIVPAAAPPAAQAAPAGADASQAIVNANLLRMFRRLRHLIDGQLTREEVILTNRVAWMIGREATDAEIEAVAQRLAAEFEPGSATPLMPAESSSRT
jgi:hypothetical protein